MLSLSLSTCKVNGSSSKRCSNFNTSQLPVNVVLLASLFFFSQFNGRSTDKISNVCSRIKCEGAFKLISNLFNNVSVEIASKRVEILKEEEAYKMYKKDERIEQMQLVKFREVSDTVWVSFEAVITENT